MIKNGRMEDWKDGRLGDELMDWKNGRLEGWKDGWLGGELM